VFPEGDPDTPKKARAAGDGKWKNSRKMLEARRKEIERMLEAFYS
jgi:hypothetical protein